MAVRMTKPSFESVVALWLRLRVHWSRLWHFLDGDLTGGRGLMAKGRREPWVEGHLNATWNAITAHSLFHIFATPTPDGGPNPTMSGEGDMRKRAWLGADDAHHRNARACSGNVEDDDMVDCGTEDDGVVEGGVFA